MNFVNRLSFVLGKGDETVDIKVYGDGSITIEPQTDDGLCSLSADNIEMLSELSDLAIHYSSNTN